MGRRPISGDYAKHNLLASLIYRYLSLVHQLVFYLNLTDQDFLFSIAIYCCAFSLSVCQALDQRIYRFDTYLICSELKLLILRWSTATLVFGEELHPTILRS